ncbi:MAG: hypothetical protein AABW88_03535, partial [Nanoarchaeota archaeon]
KPPRNPTVPVAKIAWTKYDGDCNTLDVKQVPKGQNGPAGYQTIPCVKKVEEKKQETKKEPTKPVEREVEVPGL